MKLTSMLFISLILISSECSAASKPPPEPKTTPTPTSTPEPRPPRIPNPQCHDDCPGVFWKIHQEGFVQPKQSDLEKLKNGDFFKSGVGTIVQQN
ncbi:MULTISPECIES: hypothetical protein [Citrobacter]|uniref:Uncharacterized protein n=1 Tax=Citrobacter braakii TaxID=57706 RepID=A0A8I0G697_CITBR|nr:MULTISPECIES: hypothetical protein [Citrobacter]MBD3126330.1 hypothetical protein [Citrobacter braakii]MDM3438850.1 hypothetical protein [Citrobacter sp. Cb063]MEB7708333.1 hypothetical protein [Citrobacter braakii]